MTESNLLDDRLALLVCAREGWINKVYATAGSLDRLLANGLIHNDRKPLGIETFVLTDSGKATVRAMLEAGGDE